MKVIGLDIGTTSVCGILYDSENDAVIRTVTKSNTAKLAPAFPGEKTQDAGLILRQLDAVLDELGEGACAIGVTGQMHGIVYVDGGGRPVSPLYTWQDERGNLPYNGAETYAEYLSRRGGYPLASGFGAVTHFYNTVNGLIPERAAAFCTIHDLAAMYLSGAKTARTHASDAASFGLFDRIRGCFDRERIAGCGMDPAYFPKLCGDREILGKTPGGASVCAAIGDNQASFLGSVRGRADSVLINVGTGSQISAAVGGPVHLPELELRPLTSGRFLLVGSSLCGGRAYALLEQFLRETAELVAGVPVPSAYPAMDKLTEDNLPPPDPLEVSALFCGTRSNPGLRGGIGNIGLENFTVRHLCYGFMQGIVDELYRFYQIMLPKLEHPPARLTGSGNALRNNPALVGLFSKKFGLPVSIPGQREEAAFGAALFAISQSGEFYYA